LSLRNIFLLVSLFLSKLVNSQKNRVENDPE
jgi:hypothetical protein